MSAEALTAKLKSKDITGVYVFYGDEEYTKDHYLRKLRAFCGESAAEYANVVFEPGTLTPESLAVAVDTPSFVSPWKIIEIYGFPFSGAANDVSDYLDILSELPEGVAVVFVYRSGELTEDAFIKRKPGSNDVLDFFDDSCIRVNFEKQSGARLTQWIIRHFTGNGAEITRRGAEFLPEYCGSDMYILNGEIEKLCSYYSGKALDVDDVKLVCCENYDYKLYDIVNCLGVADASRLKKVYDGLVFAKTPPEVISGTVANYFTDMAAVKKALGTGVPPAEVKKALGMADWQYNRVFNAMKNFSPETITKSLAECRRCDAEVKAGASDPYTVIEITLYRIMSYAKK